MEKQVRTRFYDVDDEGIPKRWVDMVRHTLETLGPQVLASRMVRDYVNFSTDRLVRPRDPLPRRVLHPQRNWLPGAARLWVLALRARSARRGGGVGDAPGCGLLLAVRTAIDLGGSLPRTSSCRPVYGRVDEHDVLHRPVYIALAFTGWGEDGMPRYEGEVPLERAGSYGYTVRVLPHSDLLPGHAELGLLAQA